VNGYRSEYTVSFEFLISVEEYVFKVKKNKNGIVMDETKESVVYTQKINSEMQNHPQGKYVVIIKKIRVDEE